MIHEILPVGLLECNCSILGDETTREAIVIDPGDSVDQIREVLNRHSLRVKAIVLTHGHVDHVGGSSELRRETGAPVYMNAKDRVLLAHLNEQAQWLGLDGAGGVEVDAELNDGDRLSVGSTELQILETPGHSQGSVSIWIPSENKLIAGDTLFRDSIGRTDLPEGDGQQILVSIREKLMPLPDETVVFPGHGPQTTMGREKERNYFLQRL